jgi:co-chaperonin GroES (HSP10)
MKMKIIGKDIIFRFVDDVSGGMVKQQTTQSGIIIAGQQMDQQNNARWGKVYGVGDEVTSDIVIGTYILIEPLMWSTGFTFDSETKYWRTHESKVMAVSDEEITE